jgi:hypothetical protein
MEMPVVQENSEGSNFFPNGKDNNGNVNLNGNGNDNDNEDEVRISHFSYVSPAELDRSMDVESGALSVLDEESAGDLGKLKIDDVGKPEVIHIANISAIHFISAGLFGNGRYVVMPIIWASISIISTCWLLYLSIKVYQNAEYTKDGGKTSSQMSVRFLADACASDVAMYIIITISTISNLKFGWKLFNEHWLKKILRCHCLTIQSRNEAAKALEKVTIITILFVILSSVLYVYSAVARRDPLLIEYTSKLLNVNSGIVIFFDILQNLTVMSFYLSTFFLIACWLWGCWIKHKVNLELINSICYKNLINDKFINKYYETFQALSLQSDEWRMNQLIRVLTCIPLAYLYVYVGLLISGISSDSAVNEKDLFTNSKQKVFSYVMLVIGLLFYSLVWLSVAYGGYVNDQAVRRASKNILQVKYKNKNKNKNEEKYKVLDNIDTRLKYEFDFTQIRILSIIKTIGETEGIKFIGVVLSIQNALSIGSILITIILLQP